MIDGADRPEQLHAPSSEPVDPLVGGADADVGHLEQVGRQFDVPGDRCGDEVVHVVEVPVHRAKRDTGAAGDVVHARSQVSFIEECDDCVEYGDLVAVPAGGSPVDVRVPV